MSQSWPHKRLLALGLSLAAVAGAVVLTVMPAAADSHGGGPANGTGTAAGTPTSTTTTTAAPAAPPASGGGLTQRAGEKAFAGVAGLIGQAAVQGLDVALRFLDVGNTPDFGGDPAAPENWFERQYPMMVAMGIWVMLPLLLIAIIHAISKGSMQLLLRSVLVYLPVSMLGMVVAVQFVQLLLDMTDDFAAVFTNSIEGNVTDVFKTVSCGFGVLPSGCDGGVAGAVAGSSQQSVVLMILFGIILMIVSIAVYIVLVLREASVYMATAFLPLGFATLVWPATAKYFRRMVEFLIAMIFSKIVMVAGLSLAMASTLGAAQRTEASASLMLGRGNDPATASALQAASGGATNPLAWIGPTIETIAMLLVIAFAPAMVMRVVGTLGLAEAAGAVGRALNRPSATNQLIFGNRMLTMRGSARSIAHTRMKEIPAAHAWAASTSAGDQRLALMGVARDPATNSYLITDQQLQERNVDRGQWALIKRLSASQDPDQVALAHTMLHAGSRLSGVDMSGAYGVNRVLVDDGRGGVNHLVVDRMMVDGRPVRRHDPAMLAAAVRDSLGQGASNVRVIASVDGRNQRERDNAEAIRSRMNQISQTLPAGQAVTFETVGLIDQRVHGTEATRTRLVRVATPQSPM